LNTQAQKLNLKVSGKTDMETKTIDSIGYSKIHLNGKSISDKINVLSEKLQKSGYIETQKLEQTKPNDSTFVFKFSLGKKINFIHIYIGRNTILKSILENAKNDTLIVPFPETENFLNQTLTQLEKKGFALAKLKLINIQKSNSRFSAELSLNVDKKRNLNDIVIKGYDKFPEGFKKSINRKYRNVVFNQDNLKKINADFNKIRFVKQVKYPEILFTTDSTKVYVYIEKAKINSFDGFIGFGNDDKSNLIFSGYVDLNLNNILNTGEKLAINWKSNGKDQKTFNAATEIPYIFKSPLGIKAQINIFKQDSTFQNTKTNLDLGYYFKANSRIYLGYQSTESNDIKNLNTAILSDFNNSYLTSTYEFNDFTNDDALFPDKTTFSLKIGTGNREAKTQNNKQFFGALNLKQHFYLDKKNCISLKTENFYLKSNNYVINELYRFGGINSIRGFNENSLQANVFTSIMTEYQYIISPSIYAHSILDYGYFKDQSTNNSGKLLGIGFGFGLITKNGLFNIVYGNGSSQNQAIKLSNSIVQISLKTNF
jgi:hypothetical protein